MGRDGAPICDWYSVAALGTIETCIGLDYIVLVCALNGPTDDIPLRGSVVSHGADDLGEQLFSRGDKSK